MNAREVKSFGLIVFSQLIVGFRLTVLKGQKLRSIVVEENAISRTEPLKIITIVCSNSFLCAPKIWAVRHPGNLKIRNQFSQWFQVFRSMAFVQLPNCSYQKNLQNKTRRARALRVLFLLSTT